jgi:tRNA 5-methylaminomethyl-2-thiouridine biosynthesis bifunctional protein
MHTRFGDGAHFLHTLQQWQADAARPAMLHYVAFNAEAVGKKSFVHLTPAGTQLDADSTLGAGQLRLQFEQGRVLLTLYVGPLQQGLREQRFDADVLVLDWASLPTDVPTAQMLKTLAQRCKRGTLLEFSGIAPPPLTQHLLVQAGFVGGIFDPQWDIKTSREYWRTAQTKPGHCVVVGAGISGAAVAASLARRGWQVDVLDAATQPAAGASGLPAGLVAPVPSADDNVLSRLTRVGTRMSLAQAAQSLQAGQDWAHSGVDQWQGDGLEPLHHGQAGWIKPAAMVRAWLAQPGVRFRGGVDVSHLQRDAQGWTLHDANGNEVASASHVVLANASGAFALLQRLRESAASDPGVKVGARLPAVHAVRGLVSWATHAKPEHRPFPIKPVNGHRSLIARVPQGDDWCWYLGASYQPQNQVEWPDDKNHGANVLRLEKLAPELCEALTPVFEAGALQAWKGVRCVTADRLPVVGSVLSSEPTDRSGLWICAGMGSRGLSHAFLCAELLAAQWAGEPWPIEASLAESLRAQRRQGT